MSTSTRSESTPASARELRIVVDAGEAEQFEQVAREIGMSPNEMFSVFVRRAVAERGLPFDMRLSQAEAAVNESTMRVFGVSAEALDRIAGEAAREADQAHVDAGRLPPLEPQEKRPARLVR